MAPGRKPRPAQCLQGRGTVRPKHQLTFTMCFHAQFSGLLHAQHKQPMGIPKTTRPPPCGFARLDFAGSKCVLGMVAAKHWGFLLQMDAFLNDRFARIWRNEVAFWIQFFEALVSPKRPP